MLQPSLLFWLAALQLSRRCNLLRLGQGIKFRPCGLPLLAELIPICGYQLLHGCPQLYAIYELLQRKPRHCQHCNYKCQWHTFLALLFSCTQRS